MITREQLVKIAREAAGGISRPSYCANPAAFDPHEWVIEAMQRAYEAGGRDAMDGGERTERAAFDRGYKEGHDDACQSRAGC
jgi:hypothetical protein